MNNSIAINDDDDGVDTIVVTPIRSTFRCQDGRILSYYTFLHVLQEDNNEGGTSTSSGGPPPPPPVVLYFHGFPGSGLEAKHYAAKSVVVRNGGATLVAIDRPGMGMSDPYPYPRKINRKRERSRTRTSNKEKIDEEDEEDYDDTATRNLNVFIDSVWEFVRYMGWTEFSIIGVSGGGPSSLALLASALVKQEQQQQQQHGQGRLSLTIPRPVPKIRRVCLVAAMCGSGGTDGSTEANQQVSAYVSNSSKSWWDRCMLRFNFIVMSILLRYFPRSVMAGVLRDTPGTPRADQDWMLKNPNLLNDIVDGLRVAVSRHGSYGAYHDALITFKSHHVHETALERFYNNNAQQLNVVELPQVTLYQGTDDRNVPIQQAQYMHTAIFHERSTLHIHRAVGHFSLAMSPQIIDTCCKFAVGGG